MKCFLGALVLRNPDVLELTQQVIEDQTAEISTMQDLLNEL